MGHLPVLRWIRGLLFEIINMTTPKPLLFNALVIRPILLVLLVFYHVFAIFSGAWAPIKEFLDVPTSDSTNCPSGS